MVQAGNGHDALLECENLKKEGLQILFKLNLEDVYPFSLGRHHTIFVYRYA